MNKQPSKLILFTYTILISVRQNFSLTETGLKKVTLKRRKPKNNLFKTNHNISGLIKDL